LAEVKQEVRGLGSVTRKVGNISWHKNPQPEEGWLRAICYLIVSIYCFKNICNYFDNKSHALFHIKSSFKAVITDLKLLYKV
jgi:hypothetical protein